MKRERPARRSAWKKLVPVAIFLAVAGAVLAGIGSCTTIEIDEQLLFMPDSSVAPDGFDHPGLRRDRYWLVAGDGTRLRLWHITQAEAVGTVLLFGGNAFYLAQSGAFIEAITAQPVNLIMWEYRGYGQSEGEPTVEATKRDGLAVYDWAVSAHGISPEKLLLHGHSLGTFVASYVAANRASAGVVLANPATNVSEWARYLIPWYTRLFVRVEIDAALRGESNLDRLAAVEAPILIGGGKQDRITAWQMARALYESVASDQAELVLVKKAGHNDLHSSPAFRRRYRDFIRETLGAP